MLVVEEWTSIRPGLQGRRPLATARSSGRTAVRDARAASESRYAGCGFRVAARVGSALGAPPDTIGHLRFPPCDDGFVSDEGVAARTPRVGTSLVGSGSAWFVLLGILCGYFALLLALGGHAEWDRLGVPAVPGGFFDLRSVTSGWDCARQGWGEWPVNPCDPGGRPENYPRVWMAASILGLGEDDTRVIGFLLAVTFFLAAILVLPRQATVGEAVIYGLALCSPAVMFGVERGNVDIGLFSMVAAAGLVMRRTRYGPPAASALILVAAVLKLFPIAAVGMLARLPRRAAVICVSLVVGLFAVYAAATFRDIQTIERVLPQGDEYAYGLHIFGGWLERLVAPGRMWDAALVVLAIVAALAFRRRLRSDLSTGQSRRARPLLGGCRHLCRDLCARAHLRLPTRLSPPDDSPIGTLGIRPPRTPDRDALRHPPHALAPEPLEQRAGSQRADPSLGRLDLRRRQPSAHRGARSGHCVHRTYLPPRRHTPTHWRDAINGLTS